MTDGERRLAAIMFTDMVSYTSLGQKNESLSLALLDEQRKLIRPVLARHRGREIKTMGDAFLVEFPDALDAVRCAYDIQRAVKEYNITLPDERRIRLRVGLHLGDVVESAEDISGDAVNVASRIEPLADGGGVCMTRQVYDQVRNKFELQLTSLGMKTLKNVGEPVEVYRMEMPWETDLATEASRPELRRIAVLPFVSMSPDPNDEYFADGLTEEIIDRLCQIGEMKVIARTSVMSYKKKDKTAAEIGRELRVGAIVEGSVRKAGGRIRVTAQLIRADTEEHLWSSRYDRDLEDIFEVQTDVAKQVADALRIQVFAHEIKRIQKQPTESTLAHTLYLKGRYFWNKRRPGEVEKAAGCFEEAVKEDPGFALGYVGLADCSLILRDNVGIDLEANLEKEKTMVAKALELDPELAEAHATRGLTLVDDYRFKEAEEEYKRAIELKPNLALAHMWYHNLLVAQTRWEEALRQIEIASELDPLSPVISGNMGGYCIARRDYAKALAHFQRVLELDPAFHGAHGSTATAYGLQRKFDEMRREFAINVRQMEKTFPLSRMAADAMIAHLEGDEEQLRRFLPTLESRIGETGLSSFSVACLHFYLGEPDEGFGWLERSYSRREESLLSILYHRDLDGVRNDPRYLDLLKKLGLP